MYNKIFISLLVMTAFSCKTEKSSEEVNLKSSVPGLTVGIMTDLSGLDGCGWVIKLPEKNQQGVEKFEPVNLSDFNMTLVDGQAVEFSYQPAAGASVCMVGPRITLKKIQVKK